MKIIYFILTALLYAIAYMPFWLLYRVADVLFVLIYYVARYRRRLVAKNLRLSFPDKTPKELRRIERQFYRNFSDYIVETIKLLHVSDKQILQRMQFENMAFGDEWMRNGRSVIAYFSHCFNWEWAISAPKWSSEMSSGRVRAGEIYRPLKNTWCDEIMLRMRARFGSLAIPKAQTLRRILELRRDGKQYYIGFMSDQKPSHGDPTYITSFLNHPTAMITGTETLARRLGAALVYWDIQKPKRGHYRITCIAIAEDASKLAPNEATQKYAELLQATIERDPAIWLWSHNRWKKPVQLPDDPKPKND